MKRFGTYLAIFIAASAVIVTTAATTRNDFGLGRNMEIVVNVMRELYTSYVDPIDADRLMKGAAQGMVSTLDPYTEFFPESEMQDFEIMTTGKYGGVGSLIRQKGDYVVIAQPYEGTPADLAGWKIGDKILSIDGTSTRGFTTEQVSSRLKGEPGTSVKVEVEHLNGERQSAELKRQRIVIPSIPYATRLEGGIAYIRHNDFTEGSFEEMRTVLNTLNSEAPLTGLILDYRFNGGGIMQEAIKILSLFVPRGTEVVSLRGRTKEANQVYRTDAEPTFPNLPIAVLISGNSASAAEIVAGSLQDLDRAVLIGQRSFGKGLVQTSRGMGYKTLLKLTTSKYYIPSGRCIQAIDYSHSQEGKVRIVPDSLIAEFKTRNGRKIYDGGGIMPDIRTEAQYISRFAATLYGMGFIEDFGDEWTRRHPNATVDPATFHITEQDYADFERFMADKKVPYESATRRALKSLRSAASEDRFSEIEEQLSSLEAQLKDDTQTNLQTYREQIVESIENDLVLRAAYMRGVIAHGLPADKEVSAAVALLQDMPRYRDILEHQDTAKR